MHHLLNDGPDVLLEWRESWDIRVCGVGHEHVDAFFAEASESAEVGETAVEWQLVHFEVARAEDESGRCANRNGERVRDRVVDCNELQVERSNVESLAALDLLGLWANLVFDEFRFDERERQRRAVQRDVTAQFEQIRHGPDVVFVPVCENDADDVVESIPNRGEVGKDQVDAGLRFFREQDTTVNDEQPSVELEHGHVATDFAEPAERDDSQGSRIERAGFTDKSRHVPPSCGFHPTVLRRYAAVRVECFCRHRHEVFPELFHLFGDHFDLALREGREVGAFAHGAEAEEVHERAGVHCDVH